MTSEDVLTVSAAVVALVQLAKWAGVDQRHGPLTVMLLALLGVMIWSWSTGHLAREIFWELFAGWTNVALSAAGVYGFTRAAGERLTQTK